MLWPSISTSLTSPFSTAAMKLLNEMSWSLGCCLVNRLNSRRIISPSTNQSATFLENWFTQPPGGSKRLPTLTWHISCGNDSKRLLVRLVRSFAAPRHHASKRQFSAGDDDGVHCAPRQRPSVFHAAILRVAMATRRSSRHRVFPDAPRSRYEGCQSDRIRHVPSRAGREQRMHHRRIRASMLYGLAVAVFALAPALQAQEEPAPPPLKPEELEALVAPIALYPDSLLAQMFMASTYPMEVVEAARWAKANPKVTGDALEKAMQQQSWDASVKSLTAFPQVLTMMDEKLDWTQKLGDAFLAQQKDVMDAVQRLRAKAQAKGNLETNKEQKVVVQQDPTSQTTVIQIEPADPQVVYVPSYNPTTVYGGWPPSYPPPYSY